jgi:uncharacterized protein
MTPWSNNGDPLWPLTTRRRFLRLAAAATGAAGVALESGAALASGKQGRALVDVNVSLGRWPLRRLPLEDPRELVTKLRSQGVIQAWAGALDGVLHKDLRSVNVRLVEDCQRHGHGLLLAFGSLNPKLPDWERDLRICAEVHRMRGIRLHPNYHSYRLDDPEFVRLLNLATRRRLIVQLAVRMEDERMMHPRLRVDPVDTAPLAELVKQTPGLKLVLLNALGSLHGDSLRKIVSAGDVFVEVSMLEGVGGLSALAAQVPLERILFGSHAPLFYFEAAELKLKESPLTAAQAGAIRHENAESLIRSAEQV